MIQPYRYYDPQVGRFTTQDPISLAGGLNLYQYAPNPVQWVDPFGLTKKECPESNTEHTIVPSGKAPKTSTPNSIYEVSRVDGSKSTTYYDEKGRTFSREDYGQQKSHGSLGYGEDGKALPHEHGITYNTRGFVDAKQYRQLDGNGKVVGPWISDK